MTNAEMQQYLIILCKTWLHWGVNENMRAITAGWTSDKKQLRFRAYTYQSDTMEQDAEMLADMGVYIWSQVSEYFDTQWSDCIPSKQPLQELENLGIWVYVREGEDTTGIELS